MQLTKKRQKQTRNEHLPSKCLKKSKKTLPNFVIGNNLLPPFYTHLFICRIFQERNDEIKTETDLVHSNSHPEIQKLFADLETNRTERIRRAKVTRKYRLQEITRKYDVEAEIVKRQFSSDRALIREKLIEELTAQWFQIHREKKICVPGTQPPHSPSPFLFVSVFFANCCVDFGWRVPEKRSVQVKHRKAQNFEIMVLEETKKYFGMPAAPKITRISDDDINRDLALMKVPLAKHRPPLVLEANVTSNDRMQHTK